ncbi:MAG: T9SS type A sorting domain-containing protein [Bacteroidales bacterium]|nr:T9SS type A sorting domain-containing protein [Bacteroidales bacterium]
MKKFILYIIFIFIGTLTVFADDELTVTGIYQGENLYIMNPFAPSGVGFCIFEVLINGQTSTDEIASSAFEIDLSIYNFKLGDPVEVVIKHRDGCTPQVLNPEVLLPKSTFNIESITLNKTGKLNWITSGEVGSLPFYVEQFKWNKWVRIATINGVGTPGINNYSTAVKFVTGTNKFRVKQVDYTNSARYSNVVEYRNLATEITFKPGNGLKTSNSIKFSAPTDYEIYNYYGQLIKKGYGSEVDVSSYSSGTYFLNYDNKTETFEKK